MAQFENRFVTANGIRTRYWDIGKGGPPLVLLHGLGGTIEDWAGTLRPLAQVRRVVAIDLLGCGQTDKPQNCSYSPKVMCDHILAVLEALELGQVSLNGWSLGGRIALDLAYLAPARIHRLVLTAPAGVGRDSIIDFNASFFNVLRQIATKPSASGFRMMRNAMRNKNSLRLMKFASRRVTLLVDRSTRTAFQRQLHSIIGPSGYLPNPREELLAKLPKIATPSLAIWGQQDAFAPFSHSEILLRELPQFRLKAIDRCGHTPHIEWPQIYTATVNAFLK